MTRPRFVYPFLDPTASGYENEDCDHERAEDEAAQRADDRWSERETPDRDDSWRAK